MSVCRKVLGVRGVNVPTKIWSSLEEKVSVMKRPRRSVEAIVEVRSPWQLILLNLMTKTVHRCGLSSTHAMVQPCAAGVNVLYGVPWSDIRLFYKTMNNCRIPDKHIRRCSLQWLGIILKIKIHFYIYVYILLTFVIISVNVWCAWKNFYLREFIWWSWSSFSFMIFEFLWIITFQMSATYRIFSNLIRTSFCWFLKQRKLVRSSNPHLWEDKDDSVWVTDSYSVMSVDGECDE